MTLREDFKDLRKTNKVKAADLAVGISKATISRFENGADITLSKFTKLVEMSGGEIVIINSRRIQLLEDELKLLTLKE